MKILFVLAVIIMISISAYSIISMSKNKKRLSGFAAAIGLLMFLAGILDCAGLINNSAFRGVFCFCGISCGIQVYLAWIHSFISDKNNFKPFILSASKIIAVASVLELTLFNFNAFHLWSGDYAEQQLSIGSAVITGGTSNLDRQSDILEISGNKEVLLTYNDFGKKVGTITADIEMPNYFQKVNIVVDITDETHKSYRYNIAKQVAVSGHPESMSFPCDFSGELGILRVKFTLPGEDDTMTLKSLYINKDIPFDINYYRWLGIILTSLFVIIFAKSPKLKSPFCQNKKLCNAVAAVFTIVLIVTAVKIVGYKAMFNSLEDWKGQFKLTYGNQITQEIVDAFKAGQVSLLDEVDPELLELENPYDSSQRVENNVKYKWDHVMYEGKYYSYYGIAPVILLFLPYHLITGYYFSTPLAVLIFSITGLIFLTMTYMCFAGKFFQQIPSNIVLCGLFIIQFSSGIWFSICRAYFYEISISSGFAFVTMGAYFLIKSNVISEGKTSFVSMALSSLFLAIAVLCRPTLALYCMAACLFYLFGFKKSCNKISATENGIQTAKNKKSKVLYIVSAFLPMFTLAGVQMYYNYVRFGSPLDFGIQYSLTINDFTNAQYHTHFVLISLYNYLFAVPKFEPVFPFIITPFTKLNVNGYFFSDIGNTSGILFLSLPVFAYLLSRKAYSLADKTTRLKNSVLIAVSCIIMPLIIICSVWESGYAVRYVADFSWEITIGAFAVLFTLYLKSNSSEIKSLYEKFMIAAVLWGFAVNTAQIINFAFPVDSYPEINFIMSNVFEFWR